MGDGLEAASGWAAHWRKRGWLDGMGRGWLHMNGMGGVTGLDGTQSGARTVKWVQMVPGWGEHEGASLGRRRWVCEWVRYGRGASSQRMGGANG